MIPRCGIFTILRGVIFQSDFILDLISNFIQADELVFSGLNQIQEISEKFCDVRLDMRLNMRLTCHSNGHESYNIHF